MALEDVLEAVPELRDAQSVGELSGGLTNTNYKVVTSEGSFVVRMAGRDTELLGIDRRNEAHNTAAAAETIDCRNVLRCMCLYLPEQHSREIAQKVAPQEPIEALQVPLLAVAQKLLVGAVQQLLLTREAHVVAR